MTGGLFKQWLYNWDRKLRLQKRKILLLLDNCSAHPQWLKSELTNVQLEFLPKNTTACIQPLDAGIIRNFKYFYKSFLRQQILLESEIHPQDDAKTLSKRIDILEALKITSRAWKCVTKETIQNCFNHAFSKNQENLEIDLRQNIDLTQGLDFDNLVFSQKILFHCASDSSLNYCLFDFTSSFI